MINAFANGIVNVVKTGHRHKTLMSALALLLTLLVSACATSKPPLQPPLPLQVPAPPPELMTPVEPG